MERVILARMGISDSRRCSGLVSGLGRQVLAKFA